jgi:hypothetical protein
MKRAALLVALVVVGLSTIRPQAPPAAIEPEVIESQSPLYEVAMLLKERYHKAVTYEEPILVWPGDLVAKGRDPNGPFGQWPKDRRFVIPGWLSPQRTPELDLAVLGTVIEAYNLQNNDGTLYQTNASQLGLHIVPLQMHAANGALVRATTLLDTDIRVLSALRMPSEHFRALCDAVTASGGGALRLFYARKWLDDEFAPNGLRPPKAAAQLLTAKEKERFSIVWGASGVTAREALLNLMRLSATKMTWYLLCQPSAKPENRFCVLNLDAM